MPNHIHLLARSGVTRDLAVVLRSWARKHRHQRTWSAVPKAERIPDLHHLKRQIRYVHLNPCRKVWVRDPLLWEWSTHRDLAGFVADPWIDRELLREVFRCSSARLGEVAHQYISADPSASVAGTHAPVHAPAAATDERGGDSGDPARAF